MKIPVLATALIAAVAFAVPAEAAAKKRKHAQQKPAVMQHDPYAVIDFDGRVAGRDPDPHIRAAIRRNPRPWESNQ